MVGHTVSHYKMLERLGEAGTGEVFKAEDARVPRVVALKFLLSGALDDKKRKRRVQALVLVPTVPGTPGLPCRAVRIASPVGGEHPERAGSTLCCGSTQLDMS